MAIVATEDGSHVICYESFGNKTHPCVLLIAGITAQLTWWPTALVQGLVDAGFYVVTFDHRDTGLSRQYDHLVAPALGDVIASLQRGESFSPPYTLEDMADDVAVLMDLLSINAAHMVGMSMGGMIAQLFAMRHPARTLSLTAIASTTSDTDLPPPSPEVMAFFMRPPQTDELDALIERHVQQYRLYYHPRDFDLDAVVQERQQAYHRAYHPGGNARQMLALLAAQPRGERLKQLRVPSLILHGDCDPVFSEAHARRLADCLLSSRLRLFHHMGHGIPDRLVGGMIEAMVEHFHS